jgi:hypothetical protein
VYLSVQVTTAQKTCTRIRNKEFNSLTPVLLHRSCAGNAATATIASNSGLQ